MEILLEFLLSLCYQLPVSWWRYSTFSIHLRFSVKKTVVIFCLVFLSLNMIAAFSGMYDNFTLACRFRAIMTVIMVTLSLYLIKDHAGKQIFVAAFYINALFMLTSFCLLAELLMYKNETMDHVLFKLVSFALLLLLFTPLFFKYVNAPLKSILFKCDSRTWSIVWIPAILQCFLAFVITIPVRSIENISLASPVLRFMISLCGFVFHSGIIYLVRANMETTREMCELEAERQQLVIQRYQYEKIQEEMDNSRRFRHDFRHHISLMQSILQDNSFNDYEKLRSLSAYLDEYAGSLPELEEIYYCENHVINLLLNYYASRCKEAAVQMDIHVYTEGFIPIEDTDLCTIIGNIILNAMEAASQAETHDHRIAVTLAQKNHSLYFVVENGFSGELLYTSNENMYLSTKHAGEGLGLASVIRIAERYGGSCEFGCSPDNDQIFCSRVFFLNL